jgi:4'-phosphopantetheinyl transferase
VIQVYVASLRREAAELAALRATLAPEELARAQRPFDPLLRERFVAGRGLLRRLLGAALDCPPAEVALRYGPHGKPMLAEQPAGGLSFSLTHSQDLALYALAHGLGAAQLGVDVEAIRPRERMERIVRRFFSAREQGAWLALEPARRERGFYACWARKEAVIKALGLGLALPLGSFDVSVDPDAPARLLSMGGDAAASKPWWLRDLSVGDGFAAALAVHRPPYPLAALAADAFELDVVLEALA